MAFEKIREKTLAIRILLFVSALIVWFIFIYLISPKNDDSVTAARNVNSFWVLSVFVIFIFWQILFKKKKTK